MREIPYNPFDLLSVPRRPCLDLDLLEKNFRSLSTKYHPDHSSGDRTLFEHIQKAAALLRRTSSRLQALAEEKSKEKNIPLPAQELFSTLAAAIEESVVKRNAYQKTSTALAKALLFDDLLHAQRALLHAQASLETWKHTLEEELATIDSQWPTVPEEKVIVLAKSFLFVERWEEKLNEEIFELSTLLPEH